MAKQTDYIEKIANAERRFVQLPVRAMIENRADQENSNGLYDIEGTAALVGVETDLFWFKERIEPGAFDEVLEDDVRCLFNHDPNNVLARSNKGKGTLELFLNDNGDLCYRYRTPDRQFAKDVQDMIITGDVTQSSFAFEVKEQSWVHPENPNEPSLRKIIKVKCLYDVAPVTYPAYQDTQVGKRAFDDHQAELAKAKKDEESKRAAQLDEYDAQFIYNQNKAKSNG